MVIALLLACTSPPAALSDDALNQALSAAAQVDPDALAAAVDALVAAHGSEEGEIIEGWDRPHKARAAEAWLISAFAELGLEAGVEEDDSDGWETHNLVVEIPGVERPDEIVLLSAHYDVWYTAADDNSTGVAVLLEAARILSQTAPARTVRIVAFDAEEVGLVGSLRYFQRHEDDDLRVVVNLDAIGFASDEAGTQSAPRGFTVPDTGNFLTALANGPAAEHALIVGQLAAALDLPLVGGIGSDDNQSAGTGDFHRSDHSGTWARGVPGVFLTDTAELRNPHYHTDGDLPDTLNLPFLGQVGQVVVGSVAAFAEGAP